MSTRIYVGNLPYSVTDSSLKSNFAEFGSVTSAKIMMDRESGRSKGFAFVEMESADASQAAIAALNGVSVDGRAIIVNLAKPREERGEAGGNREFRARSRPNIGYGNDGYGGGTGS